MLIYSVFCIHLPSKYLCSDIKILLPYPVHNQFILFPYFKYNSYYNKIYYDQCNLL